MVARSLSICFWFKQCPSANSMYLVSIETVTPTTIDAWTTATTTKLSRPPTVPVKLIVVETVLRGLELENTHKANAIEGGQSRAEWLNMCVLWSQWNWNRASWPYDTWLQLCEWVWRVCVWSTEKNCHFISNKWRPQVVWADTESSELNNSEVSTTLGMKVGIRPWVFWSGVHRG